MKKRIVLFTAIGGLLYLTLSSESSGPALFGNNRTGAKASLTTCGGGGCHGGTNAATTVTITVDSGTTTTPVTKYVAGQLYTIKIAGTNSNSNPKFGFEFASVSGTGASQVQAGTAVASSLPAYVYSDALSGINIIEHGAALTATTAGVYNVSFQWTAPAAGTGNVTLYCTLNAVNGINGADAGDMSNNTSVVLSEETVPNSVSSISANTAIKAYPNPFSSQFKLQMNNADAGTYTVKVYDLGGRTLFNEAVEVNGGNVETNISTANWAPGFYGIQVINKNGAQRIIPVIKQ